MYLTYQTHPNTLISAFLPEMKNTHQKTCRKHFIKEALKKYLNSVIK